MTMQPDPAIDPVIEPTEETYRGFKLFWIGQLFSIFGSSVVQYSIIWWITITTLDPVVVGYSFFFGIGVGVLVTPLAGVINDKLPRKFILFTVDLLQVFVTFYLIYLFYFDIVTIYHIFAILALRGGFQGFHQLAFNITIPTMVPEDKLQNFNALTFLGNGSMEIIGPVVGAALIAFFGIDNLELIFLLDGITFMIALIPMLLVPFPDVRQNEGEEKTLLDDFKVGVNFIRQTNGLLALLLLFSVVNFLFGSLFVVIPIMVADPNLLAGDEFVFGISLSSMQLGTVIAAAILSAKTFFDRHVNGIFVAINVLLMTMLGILVSILFKSPLILYISMFFMGGTLALGNSHSQTLWHTVVPKNIQGRVFSVRRVIAQIAIPVSVISAGYLIDWLGVINLLIVSCVVYLFVILYTRFATDILSLENEVIPEQVEEDSMPIDSLADNPEDPTTELMK